MFRVRFDKNCDLLRVQSTLFAHGVIAADLDHVRMIGGEVMQLLHLLSHTAVQDVSFNSSNSNGPELASYTFKRVAEVARRNKEARTVASMAASFPSC